MSQPITSASLTSPVVGGTGSMDWSGNGLPVTGGKPAQILLQNESGCGLRVRLRGSGRGFDLPAGAWMQGPLPLQANETGLDYTILYVLPNQPVGLLLGTYYAPGEVAVGVSLGNSPIGLSGVVSANVEQIVQDDKPAGTSVIEARPNGQVSSYVTLDNQGNLFLRETLQADNGAIASNGSGDITVSGRTTSGLLTVTGSSLLDNGAISTNGSGVLSAAVVAIAAGIGGTMMSLVWGSLNHENEYYTVRSGATHQGHLFIAWNGTSQIFPLSIGATGVAGLAAITESGAIGTIAGVSTAGPYGVPLLTAVTRDVVVSTTTLTTIASVTVPNDATNHDLVCGGSLFVGGSNTNNGIVTLEVSVTDPHEGALTLFFNVYGQTNLVNGIAQAKGQGIRCDLRHVRASPNTTVTVSYRNTAAGTIADAVSAFVQLVS